MLSTTLAWINQKCRVLIRNRRAENLRPLQQSIVATATQMEAWARRTQPAESAPAAAMWSSGSGSELEAVTPAGVQIAICLLHHVPEIN